MISSTTGIVKSIDENAQTGTTVNIDIGERLRAVLRPAQGCDGQHRGLRGGEDSHRLCGTATKYYSVEGCNVYFEMRKDGQPVNPMDYMAD